MINSIKKYGIFIYEKYPKLRPFIRILNSIVFRPKPKFSGWKMTTYHEVPWKDEYQGNVFRKASKDLNSFEITRGHEEGIKDGSLNWRHWIVSTAIRYALNFTETKNINVVECGVGDGLSAFILLREIVDKYNKKYSCYLYDSWGVMKKEDLIETSKPSTNKYAELDIERTKKNLLEFNDNIIFHQGYIPESFQMGEHPEKIIYMHIDVNSSKPTANALEFFYPRLASNGVILFDDYGWGGYDQTKNVVDKFFAEKPGILFKYPTGQAMYIHK